MSKILILNGAHPYPFAPGQLNTSLANQAKDYLEGQGHEIRLNTISDGYEVETEVEAHQWADSIIM